MEEGFKYLGFFLKPNAYRVSDWHWLIEKFEKKIHPWYYRCLSLGGRMILINSVLANLPIYWLTLAKVPPTVRHQIPRITYNFLWSAHKDQPGLHLTAWHTISRPKADGEWRIRNIYWVYHALHLKSLWRALYSEGLWGRVIRDKYLHGLSIIEWFRKPIKKTHDSSNVWNGLLDTFPMLNSFTGWLVGDGFQVRVGVDPLYGCSAILKPATVQALHSWDLFFLNQAKNPFSSDQSNYWLMAEDIGLMGMDGLDWNAYVAGLSSTGITLTSQLDRLRWSWCDSGGEPTTKTAYLAYASTMQVDTRQWWHTVLWKWNAPLKILCFMWLILMNKVLTMDNYMRRGGMGPNVCLLCLQSAETIEHLFVHCPTTLQLWDIITQ